jgi:hypothetical protein
VLTVILSKQISRKTEVGQSGRSNVTRSTIIFITSLVVIDVIIIGGVVGVEKVVQRIENTNLQAQSVQAKMIQAQAEKMQVIQAKGAPLTVNPPVRQAEESVEERSAAVRPSVQIIRDYPWLGTGGGTFFLAFQHYRPAELQAYYDHPHNDGVEFASEVGLLGLLLMVLVVAHSALLSLKLLIQGRDQLARGMAFASLMGVISLLIHGAVDFNLQIPANAMLFMILLSLPYLMKIKLKI